MSNYSLWDERYSFIWLAAALCVQYIEMKMPWHKKTKYFFSSKEDEWTKNAPICSNVHDTENTLNMEPKFEIQITSKDCNEVDFYSNEIWMGKQFLVLL